MRRLLVISRLLALLAFLGLTPVWAMEDGCCCGTGQSICEMPERPALTSAEVSDLLGLRPSGESGACAPGAEDDCACWRPIERSSKVALAAVQSSFPEHWVIASLPTAILPKVVASTRTPVVAPPWRPPISGLTEWSHALFPVPPPHLS